MSHLAMSMAGRIAPNRARPPFGAAPSTATSAASASAATKTPVPPDQPKLDPAAVRERARSIPGCQEITSQGGSVLSFMAGLPSDPSSASASAPSAGLARVNVFFASGTVGTSRVLDGRVRQTFRRNVTSLDVVERLLRHPEGPVEINEGLIGLSDDDGGGTGGGVRSGSGHSREAVLSSPRSVKKELDLADVGLCILQGEREKLEHHLLHLESSATSSSAAAVGGGGTHGGAKPDAARQGGGAAPPTVRAGTSGRRSLPVNDAPPQARPAPANGKAKRSGPQPKKQRHVGDTSSDRQGSDVDVDGGGEDGDEEDDQDEDESASSTSSVQGSKFHFKLPTDVMKQVDQCLRDIGKMDKVVKGVATNGKGTVFLYGNGGVAYTPSIPKALYQKLRLLRSSSFASRPCFVALGTRDRYFVSFNDGTADWKGPSALDKLLKKAVQSACLPRSVAFGSTFDTFFVVFHDGSWQYQGRGIPETLEEKLATRGDRADLVTVNLGPSGEWFLKAENGRMWWSGITQELDGELAKILKDGFLHSMDFGENGSYFLSYDDD